ncbi:MAG: hypothetical protein WC692_09935 [Erythrobacter sp.]
MATEAVGGGSRQRRVGGGHLGVVLDSVNRLLQFCCAFFQNPRISAGFSGFFTPSRGLHWGNTQPHGDVADGRERDSPMNHAAIHR